MSIEPWLREKIEEHDSRLTVIETTLRVTWVMLPTVFSLIGLIVVLLTR